MENKVGKDLIIPEKENIFKRFFKWITNVFHKDEIEEPQESLAEITVPKSVKMPEKIEQTSSVSDENSLEYLYQLSDEELENLDQLYDEQMEETKNEVLRLEEILQSYKQTIKKLQTEVETDF